MLPATAARLSPGKMPSNMLTRRQLLMRGTTMLVLTPIVIAGCSGYGSSSTGTVTIDAGVCNGVGGQSTVVDSHSHSICVPTADLTAPPADGATYTSSDSSSHTHTLVLTSAQLTSIQNGQTVMVTSAAAVDPVNNDNHSHNWTLRKV
jgi:hypothetical protein